MARPVCLEEEKARRDAEKSKKKEEEKKKKEEEEKEKERINNDAWQTLREVHAGDAKRRRCSKGPE